MLLLNNLPEVDLVGICEEMLLQRAIKGIRPVLYLSSNTDLECSMLMLLDEGTEDGLDGLERNTRRRPGYYVMTN
ncbi:MAG TPA: hypothetical protein VJH03_09045 [Blastocatellia bacterium]|nr:hypothetical protein [Blastocatellia bacterium]